MSLRELWTACCFQSMESGREEDIAAYVAEVIRDVCVFQDGVWYSYVGSQWRRDYGPRAQMTGRIRQAYWELRDTFHTDDEQRKITMITNRLGNREPRMRIIRILERKHRLEHALPFEEATYLIGFQNGVLDCRSGMLRPHRREDYLLDLLPYALPVASNPSIREQLLHFFGTLVPDDASRDSMLEYLALSLEGRNRHAIAVVWLGPGWHAQLALKRLVTCTFGHLSCDQPPTFLSYNFPTLPQPSPSLIRCKTKRIVFVSPDMGKKLRGTSLNLLTDDAMVTCRAVNSKVPVQYIPRFIPTLLCSTMPEISDNDQCNAKTRSVSFNDGDSFIDPTLHSEWAAEFMLLLVEHYQSYVARGHRLSDVQTPPTRF